MNQSKAREQILDFDHELWDEFEDAMRDCPECDGTTSRSFIK